MAYRDALGEPFLQHRLVIPGMTFSGGRMVYSSRNVDVDLFRVDAVWMACGFALCLVALMELLRGRVSLLGFARDWRAVVDPMNPWTRRFFERGVGDRKSARMWLGFAARSLPTAGLLAALKIVLSHALGEPDAPPPTTRSTWLEASGALLGVAAVVVLGFAATAPAVGHFARARIKPILDDALATPMGSGDYVASIRRTVLEAVFVANSVGLVWWICCVNARLTRWEDSAAYWAAHPAVLLFGCAMLFVWSANYAAGYHLRATMAATIPLFHRSAFVAIVALNMAAAASILARGGLLVLLFRSGWRPEFLPTAIEGPSGGLNIVLIATTAEGALAAARLWLARRLWRKLAERPPGEAFANG